MKTYVVLQVVEMTVRHTVRAKNAERANDRATELTERVCRSIEGRYAKLQGCRAVFGDINDSYVPARDDD